MPWHLRVFDPKGYQNPFTGTNWRHVGRERVEPVEGVRAHPVQTEMQYEQMATIAEAEQAPVTQSSGETQEKPKAMKGKPPPPQTSAMQKAEDLGDLEEEITTKQEFYGPGELKAIAQDFLVPSISFVKATDSIDEAVEKLKTMPYLVVMSERNTLCGIMTAREVLAQVGEKNTEKSLVSDYMVSPIVCCFLDTPIATVIEVIINEKIGFLPVINSEDQLKGIVTKRSILEYIFNSSRFFL